jgi:hypothetical protein
MKIKQHYARRDGMRWLPHYSSSLFTRRRRVIRTFLSWSWESISFLDERICGGVSL